MYQVPPSAAFLGDGTRSPKRSTDAPVRSGHRLFRLAAAVPASSARWSLLRQNASLASRTGPDPRWPAPGHVPVASFHRAPECSSRSSGQSADAPGTIGASRFPPGYRCSRQLLQMAAPAPECLARFLDTTRAWPHVACQRPPRSCTAARARQSDLLTLRVRSGHHVFHLAAVALRQLLQMVAPAPECLAHFLDTTAPGHVPVTCFRRALGRQPALDRVIRCYSGGNRGTGFSAWLPLCSTSSFRWTTSHPDVSLASTTLLDTARAR